MSTAERSVVGHFRRLSIQCLISRMPGGTRRYVSVLCIRLAHDVDPFRISQMITYTHPSIPNVFDHRLMTQPHSASSEAYGYCGPLTCGDDPLYFVAVRRTKPDLCGRIFLFPQIEIRIEQ